MAIATLSIDIVAGLAKLEQGMNQAVRVTDERAKAIEARWAKVGEFIGALGIAAVITEQINGLKVAINLADSIDDLAEKYGVAADKLSQYRYASEVAGTTTEAFASGLQKLSKTTAAAAGGDKELAAAFAAIGVQVKNADGSLRAVDDVLLDVADKFSRYEDGAAKAALAQSLFGKSGTDMIPVLNRGAAGIRALTDEAKQLGAAFGSDVASAAGEFNDNLARLKLASEGAKVALAGSLLPTLNATLEAFIANRKEAGTFVAILQTIGQGLAARTGFDEQGRLQARAETQSRTLKVLTQQYELFASAAKSGNESAAKTAEKLRQQIDAVRKAAQKTSADLQGLAGVLDPTVNEDALSRRLARGEGAGKTAAPVINKESAGEIQKAEQFTKQLVARLQDKIDVNRAELAVGRDLTEAERLRLEVAKDLASSDAKLSAAQRARIAAKVEEAVATAKLRQDQQDLIKTQAATQALSERQLQALSQTAEARIADNQQLREYVEELGLSTTQLDELRQGRLKHAIAVEEEALALARNAEASAGEIAHREQNIRLLQQQLGLRQQVADRGKSERTDPTVGAARAVEDYMQKVVDAGTATREAVGSAFGALESDLTESLASGKFSVKSFISTVIAEFYRLAVVRPLINSLAGAFGGASGGSSLITSLFAGGRATGGPVASRRLYQINETGVPEVGTFNGKDYLLTGSTSGRVTPLRPAGRGGGGTTQQTNVENHYHIQAGITRNEVLSLLQQFGGSIKADIARSARTGGAFSS